MEITKINDTQVEVTKEVAPVKVEKRIYERAFIEQQIKNITAQRDEMIALKEAELAECNAILDEIDNGVVEVEKVVKEVVEEVVEEIIDIKK